LARREYRHTKDKPEPIPNSDILDVRHDFAQKIGELAAHWNALDINMLGMFTILLAGEEELAFELYYDVLRGESYQRNKALRKAAKVRQIAEGVLDRIFAFSEEVDRARKERNYFVHALWASVEGSDSLFAVKDKTEWLRNNNAIAAWNLAIRKGLVQGQMVTGLAYFDFWEYRISDIQEIIDHVKALCDRLYSLQKKISILCFLRPVEPLWMKAGSTLRRLHLVPPTAQNGPEAQLPDQPPAQPE
jgi:hypothetical protein